MNLAYGQGGLKLEINIPPQHISAKSKGVLIIEGGVSSSEYGMCMLLAKQGYIMLWGLLLTSVDLKQQQQQKKTILVSYYTICNVCSGTALDQTKFHHKSSQCLSCYQGWTRKADILLSSGYHIASLVYKAVDFVCDLKK